ncbi:MAG: stearoyl-CoA desaturase (delta-9 desaturase) [Oceanicoccus sp.]|jgi:stearoyl-CoA desaturase (delta-9 desaturase)
MSKLDNNAKCASKSSNKPALLWLQAIIFSATLLIALTAVPWYGVSHGYSWGLIVIALLFLWANGLSITAGYHRLWSHNAYKAHPALRLLLALFGAAALQNSALIWCSGHRRHHRYVDNIELDPYSAKRGLWFSHIGWMLREYDTNKEDFSNARDLQRDPIVMWQHRNYLTIAISMNIIPPLLIGWLLGDIIGSVLLVGVLRLVISHHTTFFINSLAHYWGKQPYTDSNSARDNTIIAFFTYGEGYHNFHHLFQNDYRNGARWWQFDPTKWLISAGAWLGLTKELNRIPNFKIHRALLDMQFKRAEQQLETINAPSEWTAQWRDCLDCEYQQFSANMTEWNDLRQQWYEQKRNQFNEATQELSRELQQRWEHTNMHTRFKELEYALKMQRKRLQYLSLQLSTPLAI